jgi:deoxyribonuclease V
MKLAVAVRFHDDGAALAAAVAFDEWDSPQASRTFMSRIAAVDKPARGASGLRELPCLAHLLREHALEPDVIVIDGAVHLDAAQRPGLGQALFDVLGGRTAIIGASTKPIPGMPAQFEVVREEESRPLIVTCVGVDLGAAKVRIRTMHGKRRVPTLLKLVARIAHGSAP